MMAAISSLDKVRARANSRAEADRSWREAIIQAHLDGYSNREIADAAGLTHEGVRHILKKAGLK